MTLRMGFTDAGKALILNAWMRGAALGAPATAYLATFSVAPDGTGGGTELTGGTWARKAVTMSSLNWAAASGTWPAATTISNSSELQSNVTPVGFTPATAVAGGLFDAATNGTLLIFWENLANYKVVTVDTGTDTLTSTAHGKSNAQIVRYRNDNGSAIGGLNETTDYYVVGATANTFQLSLTQGGAAIDLTSVGTGTHYVADSVMQQLLPSNIVYYRIGDIVVGLR